MSVVWHDRASGIQALIPTPLRHTAWPGRCAGEVYEAQPAHRTPLLPNREGGCGVQQTGSLTPGTLENGEVRYEERSRHCTNCAGSFLVGVVQIVHRLYPLRVAGPSGTPPMRTGGRRSHRAHTHDVFFYFLLLTVRQQMGCQRPYLLRTHTALSSFQDRASTKIAQELLDDSS